MRKGDREQRRPHIFVRKYNCNSSASSRDENVGMGNGLQSSHECLVRYHSFYCNSNIQFQLHCISTVYNQAEMHQ